MGPRRTASATIVPILLYHAVTDSPGHHIAPFAVSPAAFEEHLDLVTAAGYRCVTFGELLQYEAAGAVPERTAVITFDDGYADFALNALPALQARSLPSSLYLTTGWLADGGAREPGPTDPMLSFRQLPELLAQGVELGAHSHSHPQMDTLGAKALREELSRPKELLEDVLGQAVTTFAYPHGYNGPRVRRATRQAGYESGAAVRNTLHQPGEDLFAISRLTVTADTTPTDVSAWLAGTAGVKPVGEALQTKGWRAYRRGCAVLRRAPGNVYR